MLSKPIILGHGGSERKSEPQGGPDRAENARQIQALTQRMNQESERTAALDERVDKLVGSIGALISHIPPSSLVQ
jgi:hypothetical protein